jgi:transcriptional antiterminator NusG
MFIEEQTERDSEGKEEQPQAVASEPAAVQQEEVPQKSAHPDMKWYVVHSLSGQEGKVKETIEGRVQAEEMGSLVAQVLVPTENVSEVKSGKKRVSTRKFYPGYILVQMILNDDSWYFIRNTPGVIGFIGSGKPVPLTDEEVGAILSQIEEKKEKVKPKVMFDIGETVKVTEGPFVNFTGTIDEINPERGKLKVSVSIFGRATPVELEYWQVEKT